MSLPILNPDPKLAKPQYLKYMYKEVLFKGRKMKVCSYTTHSQKGSYERGLAWGETTYGVLERSRTKNTRTLSADHGKTWHKFDSWGECEKWAVRRTPKGKLILGQRMDKELAFEGIQAINRKWEGPSYRWRP